MTKLNILGIVGCIIIILIMYYVFYMRKSTPESLLPGPMSSPPHIRFNKEVRVKCIDTGDSWTCPLKQSRQSTDIDIGYTHNTQNSRYDREEEFITKSNKNKTPFKSQIRFNDIAETYNSTSNVDSPLYGDNNWGNPGSWEKHVVELTNSAMSDTEQTYRTKASPVSKTTNQILNKLARKY